MIGHLFTVLIAQPIFNLLVLIYALIPTHNFGAAIIIFTIVIRLLLWPLVRKQLHQTKMMRKLQPELKRIKKEAKGDRQRESAMTMELYKERGVNPFGSIGILLVQLPILIALYHGLRMVIDNPHQMVDFAYPALQHLPWMQQLGDNIHLFDGTLFGIVDLTRAATGSQGLYLPALLLVLASAAVQYYQTKQLMPSDKDGRSLRTIMKEAGSGKSADQSEVNAAVGRSTRYLMPVMIFLFTINLASALSLYWFVGGLVAYIQQSIVLKEDTEEMEELADAGASSGSKVTIKNAGTIPEAEIVDAKEKAEAKENPKKSKSANKKRSNKKKKRRK